MDTIDAKARQYIEHGAQNILRNTGLTVEDLRSNQPVLDVGCGIGLIARRARMDGIAVTCLDPHPSHFGQKFIRDLAIERLLSYKPQHELVYFLNGLGRSKSRTTYSNAIRNALHKHGITIDEAELEQWSRYCDSEDDLDVIAEPIESVTSLQRERFGLILSHRGPPLHPISTVAAMRDGAMGIADLLRPGGRCHMGPGPIALWGDGDRLESREVDDVSRCHEETLAVLRELFKEHGTVTGHVIHHSDPEKPDSRYYVFRKK